MCCDGLAENKTEAHAIRDNEQMVFCAGSSKYIACYVKIIFCVFLKFFYKDATGQKRKDQNFIILAEMWRKNFFSFTTFWKKTELQ